MIRRHSLEEIRAGVAERLRARHAEIVEAIFACIRDLVPDSVGSEDPEFVVGLREAVAGAVTYGLASVEHGEEWADAIPLAAVSQARRAANAGVSLTTVLRRYVVGHQRLSAFVLEEIELGNPSNEQRATLLLQTSTALSTLLGRLQTSITEAYMHEMSRKKCSREQRLSELVQRLLAGGSVDSGELGYELKTEHVAVLATGASAERAVLALADGLDRQLLKVPRIDGTVWAWLGGHHGLALTRVEQILSEDIYAGVKVAAGARASGVVGFRLTHQQAQAALRIAQSSHRCITRFEDVVLESLALQNGAMASSLIDLYLAPLGNQGDGAELRQTLRAYFAAGRQASAAASLLGVERRTVAYRLHKIEELLDYGLNAHLAELEVALRLEDLLKLAGDTALYSRPIKSCGHNAPKGPSNS
jgi:hypothetical protein